MKEERSESFNFRLCRWRMRSALPAVQGREPRLRASRSEQGPERDVRASTGLVPSISLGKKASWVRSKVNLVEPVTVSQVIRSVNE